MADYTKNFQLKKPAQGDFYNVEDQNGNMDIIDEALQGNSVALDAHKTSEDHDGRYYTETEMDIKLGDKSDTGHIHDDRYYTESEINTKLDGKSNTNHGHSGMLVTGDVVDNCTSTATNKPLSAKQGKTLWDKIVDAVSALTTHKSSGDHDGRYYTENEINTKLGGKSDTSHNHDGSYVKKNSTAELGGIQVGNKISNGHGVIDFYQNGKCRFTMYAEDEHKLVIKPVNTIANGNSYKVDVQWSLTINGRIPIVTNDIVNNCTSADHTKILSAAQGKLLMDKINQLNSETSGNVHFNTNYIENTGTLRWKKRGRFVTVEILDINLKPGVDTANVAVICTGLPGPLGGEFYTGIAGFNTANNTATQMRMKVGSDGSLKPWYIGTTASKIALSGSFSYISAG